MAERADHAPVKSGLTTPSLVPALDMAAVPDELDGKSHVNEMEHRPAQTRIVLVN